MIPALLRYLDSPEPMPLATGFAIAAVTMLGCCGILAIVGMVTT